MQSMPKAPAMGWSRNLTGCILRTRSSVSWPDSLSRRRPSSDHHGDRFGQTRLSPVLFRLRSAVLLLLLLLALANALVLRLDHIVELGFLLAGKRLAHLANAPLPEIAHLLHLLVARE